MRHCPKCNAEYLDTVALCSEDGTPLIAGPEEHEMDGPSNDVTRLTTLITLDDRFEADELAQDLADEGYDVALVTNRSPTMGTLTTPGPALYSIVVPDTEAAAAATLVKQWQDELERDPGAAERAAVEEEAAGEAR